jgi:flagellar protein FliO/FliZ
MNYTIAVLIVLGLMVLFVWLIRSGRLQQLSARVSAVSVETATSLGERRQLVIVRVEGRRLLLGVTSTQVTLVTELQAKPEEALQQ